MRSRNTSSLHGRVKPPIGWSNPNSSSARLRNSLKEGSFRNEIGTTNLFFSFSICSPTYTTICPLGTWSNDDDVRFLYSFNICFVAFVIAQRLRPIFVFALGPEVLNDFSMKVFFLRFPVHLGWRKVVMRLPIFIINGESLK